MTAKHLTVRDVPKPLAQALDREARRRGTSLNQTVKELLGRALGLASAPFDNGLGDLAGAWDDAQFEEFERNTAAFAHIDEQLWR